MTTLRLASMVLLLALPGMAVAGSLEDEMAERMTAGKLAAETGDAATAERVFAGIVADAPMASRCEARVRLGAVQKQQGRADEAFASFEQAARECGHEREPMRLLVSVMRGVTPDPEAWSRMPLPVNVSLDRVGESRLLAFELWFGDVRHPRGWPSEGFTGEPVDLSMRDALLGDIFRLFSQFTGMQYVLASESARRTISLELTETPWDQAVHLILETNNLRAREIEGGWLIEDAASASAGDVTHLPIRTREFEGSVVVEDGASPPSR